MKKTKILKIQEKEVTILVNDKNDFICLTDMLKAKEGDFFITDWLRNRNTLEFLGVWEQLNNPNFNYGEFATIKSQAGLNSFKISVKEWVSKTNSIGIFAQSGRYGGTYAHKDIAFEFGSWISPTFKLYLIREYQRLKEFESSQLNLEWNVKRILSKINYRIHTDAIKNVIIPKLELSNMKEWIIYAEEADILNVALFGCTAKDWRCSNPELAKKGLNIRDFASINELAVMSNMESFNAYLIEQEIERYQRYLKLQELAIKQLKILDNKNFMNELNSKI